MLANLVVSGNTASAYQTETTMRVESLESRQFLTITTASYDPASQVLTFIGNDKRDILEITPRASGGVTASFDAKDVDFTGPIRRISINTGGAGDLISLATVVGIPANIDGGAGDDFINGTFADDTLNGEGGNDVILGGRGNDVIDGGLQGDLLVGSLGNDTLFAASSNINDDTITGGRGDDLVDYSTFAGPVTVGIGAVVAPTQESDKILGDVESVIGSPLADNIRNATKRGMRIDGADGDDTLTGGSGNDTLIAGAGNNQLFGNAGNDRFVLIGIGLDTVNGGTGSDSVDGGANDDTITDVP